MNRFSWEWILRSDTNESETINAFEFGGGVHFTSLLSRRAMPISKLSRIVTEFIFYSHQKEDCYFFNDLTRVMFSLVLAILIDAFLLLLLLLRFSFSSFYRCIDNLYFWLVCALSLYIFCLFFYRTIQHFLVNV